MQLSKLFFLIPFNPLKFHLIFYHVK